MLIKGGRVAAELCDDIAETARWEKVLFRWTLNKTLFIQFFFIIFVVQ